MIIFVVYVKKYILSNPVHLDRILTRLGKLAKMRGSLLTEFPLWTVPVVDLASTAHWQGNRRNPIPAATLPKRRVVALRQPVLGCFVYFPI